ncbi:MAG: ABC transporter permease [Streptomycetales bacterium]
MSLPRRAVLALRWGSIAGVVAFWEAVVRLFFPDSLFVAPPSRIALATIGTLQDPHYVQALRATAVEFVVAFLLAGVAGVLLGAGLGATRRLFSPARNLIQVAFALPQVAVYPLFVLWLGVGFSSKVAFGVTHGIFPVLLGTMAAVKLVDGTLIDAVRAMGGGRLEVFRKVVLPSVLPDIVSALRIAAALCLLGVLLAELMVSVQGIGEILHAVSSSFQPARLYALVAVICLAAVAVNTALGAAERRLSRWRPQPFG